MSFIKQEALKLQHSSKLLRIRRLNWRVCTRDRVIKEFKKIETAANDETYPFTIFSCVHTENINEETIELNFGSNPIGVIRRENEATEIGLIERKSHETEQGCGLVVSQNSMGSIAIIMYPYRSKRLEREEENIILYYGLHPDDITIPLINKAIKFFFLYARTSSIYGIGCKPSIIENIPIFYLKFIDIRNRKEMADPVLKFFLEWGKAIIVALAAIILTEYFKH